MAGGAASAAAGQPGGAHLHRLSHTRRRVRHLYPGSRVQGAATYRWILELPNDVKNGVR